MTASWLRRVTSPRAWKAKVAAMISLLRRLGKDLLTTFWGPDPVPPPAPVKRNWVLRVLLVASVGLVAITSTYLQDTRHMSGPISMLFGLVTVLPLLPLWRRPLWAWRIAFVGLLIGGIGQTALEFWPWSPAQMIITVVVMFGVALREPPGVVFWMGVSAVLMVWFRVGASNIAGTTVILTVLLVLGEQIGRRRRIQRALVAQSERGEIAEAREAVLVERTRIARELHDVVAHSMSLVAVRAETAPYRLQGLSEPVKEEFLALAGTARDTLTELRRLLGVLRTDQTEAELAPQPDLSDLDDLIGSARDAGMQVSINISGVPESAAIGLTVYRIVQEALSNAARHAVGAPVEVKVTTTKKQTRVEVSNGPGVSASGTSGTGHGLVGMRERVELLGGTLRTGPTHAGGFVVEATIPGGRA